MTPTYAVEPRFWREFDRLDAAQQAAFLAARDAFVHALEHTPGPFPPRLRVKRVQGTTGVWELSWAPDGRATFRYGDERHPGVPHIIWLRIGSHAIFD